MALSIKDPETERIVRELAKASGEGLTTAIKHAAEDRLKRIRPHSGLDLAEELMEIGRRCAALPVLDGRTPEEIIGYDEHGLPT